VFRSTDGGSTWSDFSEGLPEGTYVSSLATEGEWGEVTLLGTYGDGIYRRNCSMASVEEPAQTDVSGARLICSPNPFSNEAKISYRVPQAEHITLSIYAVSGRLVATLVDGSVAAGLHTTAWYGADASGDPVAPGLYFMEIRSSTGRRIAPIVYLN
jgi:hypothetical protein